MDKKGLSSRSSFGAFLASFGYAAQGVRFAVKGRNFKVQLLFAVIAIALGFAFCISTVEWFALLICCAVVLMGECMNTGIEQAVDLACPDRNPKAKAAKDVAAGGVLIASFVSLLVGIIIFLPRIYSLFFR